MAAELIDTITQLGSVYLKDGDELARQNLIASASALIQKLENPGEQMARIGWGEPSRTAALRTAYDLGLLAKIGQQPVASDELAVQVKAAPELVARTLKHLAANGILNEVARDKYIGTPFSIATNDPAVGGGLLYSFEAMIPTFQKLPEFLAKTKYQVPSDASAGPVQFGLDTEQPFFAYLKERARIGNAFNNFMAGYAKARPRWIDIYPVSERLTGCENNAPLFVDVGGGLGHETAIFHEAHPDLPGKLIVQDQISVVQDATAATSLPSTINIVAHDFFTPQPSTFAAAKVYFMRLILHDWPDAECTKILSHIKNAMKKGYSKLIINETVLRDVGAPWQQTSLDWTMMSMLVSKERTENQWRTLLATAGLKINGIWHKGTESVMEAILMEE